MKQRVRLALLLLCGILLFSAAAKSSGQEQDLSGWVFRETGEGTLSVSGYPLAREAKVPWNRDDLNSSWGDQYYHLEIPQQVNGVPVTGIDRLAFYGLLYLGSLVIPEGVVSIGDDAFKACGIWTLTIPESVKEIGAGVLWMNDCVLRVSEGSYAHVKILEIGGTGDRDDLVVIPREIGKTNPGEATPPEAVVLADLSALAGSGTQEEPYLIGGREDLFTLQAFVNSGDKCEGQYFQLTQDIALNVGLDLSVEWIPLGQFSGTLDGAGYAITGIYVPNYYALLQRCIDDGTADFLFDSPSLPKDKSALNYGSGLIGILDDSGTVRNLTVSGRVENPRYQGEDSPAGGICAENKGTIENCASYVTFYDTGGLLRGISHGLYGGICPISYGHIYNCVDESRVYLSPDEYQDYSRIGRLYTTPYEFYDSDIRIALLAKTRFIDNSHMMGIATPETWNHYQPGTPPAWNNQEKASSAYAEADPARILPGSGQADDPYLLGGKEDLLAFQALINGGNECEGLYFRLTQDIALNEGLDLTLEWLPLDRFSGTLDGAGYAITGLYVPSILLYEPAAISLLRNSVYRSNDRGIMLDGGAFITTLGEKGLVRNLTISGRIDCPLFSVNSKLAGGISARNYGTIESCVSYISFYLPPYCEFFEIGGISGLNHGIISSCTDESRFYMDPAYPEKHPDKISYVEYYGISQDFDLLEDDKIVPKQIDCVDHSQSMGLSAPEVWNHYKPLQAHIDQDTEQTVENEEIIVSGKELGVALEHYYGMEPEYTGDDRHIVIRTHPVSHPRTKITYFAQSAYKGDNDRFNSEYWPEESYSQGSSAGCTLCAHAMTLSSLLSHKDLVITPAMLLAAEHQNSQLFVGVKLDSEDRVADWATEQLNQSGPGGGTVKVNVILYRTKDNGTPKQEYKTMFPDRTKNWAAVDEALLRFLNDPNSYSPPIVRIYVDSMPRTIKVDGVDKTVSNNTHSVVVIGKSDDSTYRIIDSSTNYGMVLKQCGTQEVDYGASDIDRKNDIYTSIPLSIIQYSITKP